MLYTVCGKSQEMQNTKLGVISKVYFDRMPLKMEVEKS